MQYERLNVKVYVHNVFRQLIVLCQWHGCCLQSVQLSEPLVFLTKMYFLVILRNNFYAVKEQRLYLNRSLFLLSNNVHISISHRKYTLYFPKKHKKSSSLVNPRVLYIQNRNYYKKCIHGYVELSIHN